MRASRPVHPPEKRSHTNSYLKIGFRGKKAWDYRKEGESGEEANACDEIFVRQGGLRLHVVHEELGLQV